MLNNLFTFFSHFRLQRTVLSFVMMLWIGAFSALHGQTIFALSGNNLVSFNAQTPALVLSSTAISGLETNYIIAGMDFRPATGELYILGYRQYNRRSAIVHPEYQHSRRNGYWRRPHHAGFGYG